MADPSAIVPWALGPVVVALWRALEGSRAQHLAAAQAELKHERDERARERADATATIQALGKRLDAIAVQLERERLQAAGVAVRIRQDSKIDNTFADDMPTAVRDRADLIAPNTSPPGVHPQTSRELRRYVHPESATTPPEPLARRRER